MKAAAPRSGFLSQVLRALNGRCSHWRIVGWFALILLDTTRTAAVETQYLAFQIFEGSSDPAIPFDRVVAYTPRQKIATIAHDIASTIGITGVPGRRLAIVLGPISFDHTDAEARQIIQDGFMIARTEDVAIAFHIDDAMFWANRSDLVGDPANVEWTDFSGTRSTSLKLDWAHPAAPRMCYNAPRIQTEVTRRARDVIGAEIASQIASLRMLGKEELFAGVIAGWESHMGRDAATNEPLGFHALTNRGFGSGRPPADPATEIASIVSEFIGLWTSGLAQAGISPDRIYTHVAFMTQAQFASNPMPAGVTYGTMVNLLPSSQQPSVAFVTHARPGFSTYPVNGVIDQIQQERASRGNPTWASSEGTNLIPPGPAGNSGMSMETYLADRFNRGAALVNIFGWGIGGPAVKDTNVFRIATEGQEALTAYRAFLNGQALTAPARLINVSTRLHAGTGDGVPIVGFAIRDGSKTVAIRVLGPTLSVFGVPDLLANPNLQLVQMSDQATLLANDNWQDDPTGAGYLTRSGLAPGSASESGTVRLLAPGNYTAIVRGEDGETGNCLVEVYDLEADSLSRLANLSTRGFVGLGDQCMIAGFVVGSGKPRRILVRSLGPSLAFFGVAGVLPDPILDVYSGANVVRSNDNWQDSQAEEISLTGLAPSDSREPAIILTLGPGAYTATVRGKNGATGNALVEVDELP